MVGVDGGGVDGNMEVAVAEKSGCEAARCCRTYLLQEGAFTSYGSSAVVGGGGHVSVAVG